MSEPERKRFLANAAADAARLSRLVERLLDLARADMTAPDRDAAADIASVCRTVADAFRSDRFRVEVDAPAGLAARIAPEVLATVLETLVENSVQAGAAALVMRAERASDSITVTVADDGPGIAAADRERVFEPFFTGRRDAGGAGMGLAIVRSLLAANGGTVAVQPSTAGAVFVISVPGAAAS